MIYSKRLQTTIPVNINRTCYNLGNFGIITRYDIKDNKIPVGRVDLKDEPYGVKVLFVENKNPQLYSGVGQVADQIEVEHCVNRGLRKIEVQSDAALNSHALHYLRGKRFKLSDINEIVKKIIDSTPKGEKYNTRFLGSVPMYMPAELVQKYLNMIKTHPLLNKFK